MADERKAQLAFAVDGSEVKPGLEQIKRDVRDMAQDVARSGKDAAKGISDIGNGAPAAAEKVDSATRSMIGAIQRTAAAMEAGEKGTSRYFETLANQRGISGDVLKPYLDQLRQAEAAQELARKSMGGMQVSAAQTAAALRQLPMQFSDIVVSLQGGQKPLTVFLQQGSQIKDSFGGAGAAVRAMSGYVAGLVSPLTLAAAGFAAFGFAAAKAETSLSGANSIAVQLEATGRAADLSRAYIRTLTQDLQLLPEVSRSAAKAIVQEFVGAREIGGELFRSLSLTVADFAAATGRDAPAAAKVLAKAFNDPIQGAKQLDEELGLLTASQYVAINAMAAVGDKAGAQRVLLEALQASTKGLADKALTPLGKAMDDLGNAWEKTMANMEKTGALGSVNAAIGGVIEKVAELVGWLGRARLPPWLESSFKGGLNGMVYRAIAAPGAKEPNAGGASGSWGPSEGATGSWAPAVTPQDDQIKNLLELTKGYKSNASAMAEVRKQGDLLRDSLKELQDQGKGNSAVAVELQSRLDGVKERLKSMARKDSGAAGTGQTEVANLQGRIDAERAYLDLLREQGPAALKLTDAEKQVYRIRRELQTDMEGQTRVQKERALAKAEELASLEKERTAFERSIKGLEESKTAYAALIDATHKDALAIENHANELAASNAVWGKGKVAIEEYRLALIKAKLSEVENGSDSSYDPAYVAALREKAAAQEHVVNETRIADYKELAQKQTEWARQIAEEAVLYQDELALLGLTAREREKIVAVRKVELDLAKKKAEIERSGSTDDKKRELIAAAEATAEQAKATAIAKANLNELLDIVNSVDRTAQHVWTNVFEGGSNAFKKLGQTLKAAVLDLLYQLVIKKWVVSITANVLGSLTGNVASSLLGGGGGPMGMLGNLGSIAGIGNSAMSLFSGSSAITGVPIGMGIGAEGAIGAGAAASGGFGSMLAAIPGWGWALGGLALLAGSGLFKDNSGTPHWGAGATYDNGATTGGRDIYDNAHFSMGIQGEYSSKVQPFVDGVVKGVGSTLDGISRAFGGKGGYQVSTAYADDSSKDPSFGSFRISKDGKSIVDWNDTRADKWAPRNFADGEEGQKLYLAEIAKDTRKVLLDMELPSWAHHMLEAVGDAANMDDLAKVVQQIGEIQTLFVRLGDTLVGFADITDKAFEALLNASGGAQALAANTDAFYQGFYSEDERKAIAKRQLSAKLKDLGVDIDLEDPEARKKYRKLVEDELAKANGEEAAKAVLKGNLTDAIVGKGGLDALGGKDIESIVRAALGPDVAASDVDIGKLKEGLASLDTAGMSADKLKESVGKLLEPIVGTGKSAAETAAALLGLSGAFAGVTTSAEDAAAAEKKRKDEAEQARKELIGSTYDLFKRALSRDRDALSQEASGLTSSINAITSAVSGLRSNAKDLYGSVDSTQQMLAAQGMVYIEQALAGVRGGASITGFAGLTDAISAARGGINGGNYTSEFERQRDTLALAGQLTELGNLGDLQLSVQDRQLKALQQQIEYLDNLGKRADALVNGTEELTKTVDEYFKQLIGLIKPAGKPATGAKPGLSGDGFVAGGGSSGGNTAPAAGPGMRSSDGRYYIETDLGSFGQRFDVASEAEQKRLEELESHWMGWSQAAEGDIGKFYATARDAGYSMQELAAIWGFNYADVVRSAQAAGIPAFASGAAFTNGIATRPTAFNMGLMGEAGSEGILPLANVGGRLGVYAMGGSAPSNVEVVAELRALREENQRQAGEIARLNLRMAKVLERWDGDGMPPTREEATA